MALSTRSFAWPGRVIHGFYGGALCAPVRQVTADAVNSVRAFSGYSLLTGLGLMLGLVRELAVASTFGLSPQLDVFVAVMTVQLFFGAQVGNALETAFIGCVAKQSGADDVLRSVKSSAYGVVLVNAGVVLCLVMSGAWALEGMFPRFSSGQQALAAHLLSALLLPMVFASTAGLLRGALAVIGDFVPGFVAGSIVSVCTIGSILLFSSRLGIDALTLGVGVGNLGVLGLFLGRLAILTRESRPQAPGVSLAMPHGGWVVLWGAAGMVLVGELAYAGVALTERSLASWLPAGSIAAFFYASTIVSVPLSLVVVPMTTRLFPDMVEAFGRNRRAGFAQFRVHALLLMVMSGVVVVVVNLFSQTIVETIFLRGRFSVDHARFTASILSVTIFSLPFISLGRLIRNSSYSLSDYRTPIVGMTVQWMILVGAGVFLVPRWGAQGLAVAMVAGEAANLLTMSLSLRMRMQST